jgi:hypothetical protein
MTTTETRYRIERRRDDGPWCQYHLPPGEDPIECFQRATSVTSGDYGYNAGDYEWRLVKLAITTETEVVKTATRNG